MLPQLRGLIAGVSLAVLVAVAVQWPVAVAEEPADTKALSPDDAVALVRREAEGKVVRVDSRQEVAGLVYHIRVLTPDGRLREYRVDAATGALH
jgi:uncharacterized membrane protein YkoI